MQDSASLLGELGPFAKRFEWFAVRDCQLQMTEAVEAAIEQKTHLIAESGTGTGKTFAYLVPPLINKKKVIVSTRTKNLQEQLYSKDVEWVRSTLGLELDVQVLKGRSNYFCLYRHENLSRQIDMFEDKNAFERVFDWVMNTEDGDLSRYPSLNAEQRAQVTSTSLNCLGGSCEFSRDCYVYKARRKAIKADVLIVNHSLLCLNIANSDEDGQGFLGDADVIVVDEAHRFPEIAAQTLGIDISAERLIQFCKDFADGAMISDIDLAWADKQCKLINQAVQSARGALPSSSVKGEIPQLENNSSFIAEYKKIMQHLDEVSKELANHDEESRELQNIRDHAVQIIEESNSYFERQSEDNASWWETSRKGFRLSRIPLEPNKHYGPLIDRFDGSFIFTSATIAVGEDFSHFQQRLGLHDTVSLRWDSPFDFNKQALIYLPPGLPDPTPNHRDEYDEAVARMVEQVVKISHGRTFVLFTSYSSLDMAYRYLKDRVNYTLLRQGDGKSPVHLLKLFNEDGNAILLGTSTFWEGVDVKGDALSCVVIAKLPFIPPNDPLLVARQNLMNKNNQNIFFDWQVPTAALQLKQGVGRLIRDVTDKGVLILCDPRIRSKGYGRTFLESLPPMRRTDQIEDVRKFFADEYSGG